MLTNAFKVQKVKKLCIKLNMINVWLIDRRKKWGTEVLWKGAEVMQFQMSFFLHLDQERYEHNLINYTLIREYSWHIYSEKENRAPIFSLASCDDRMSRLIIATQTLWEKSIFETFRRALPSKR